MLKITNCHQLPPTAAQAISELKRLADGIAAGEVLVPMQARPPAPERPTTRDLLLQVGIHLAG